MRRHTPLHAQACACARCNPAMPGVVAAAQARALRRLGAVIVGVIIILLLAAAGGPSPLVIIGH